jgi:hypothetical protein
MDLCSETKNKKLREKGRGHWNKLLRVALLGFSSSSSLVGHRTLFPLKAKEKNV